jgi:hypothetical protein
VPVTLDSFPLGAADHLNVPEDLSKVSYVEEEYFVSGTANGYAWDNGSQGLRMGRLTSIRVA